LRSLGMSRRYKSLFRKLCCSDVIKGSADIYYQHMNNDAQDQWTPQTLTN
jgi:hypothetical protein